MSEVCLFFPPGIHKNPFEFSKTWPWHQILKSSVCFLPRMHYFQLVYDRKTRPRRKPRARSTGTACSNIWRKKPWSIRTERTSCPSLERRKVCLFFFILQKYKFRWWPLGGSTKAHLVPDSSPLHSCWFLFSFSESFSHFKCEPAAVFNFLLILKNFLWFVFLDFISQNVLG